MDITDLMRNAQVAERHMHKRASAAIQRDVADAIKAMDGLPACPVSPEEHAAACDALHEAGFDPPECEGME